MPSKQRPVGSPIDNNSLDLLSNNAAFLVLLFYKKSTMSFRVVSEIAIVPESECKKPNLIVSSAENTLWKAVVASAVPSTMAPISFVLNFI